MLLTLPLTKAWPYLLSELPAACTHFLWRQSLSENVYLLLKQNKDWSHHVCANSLIWPFCHADEDQMQQAWTCCTVGSRSSGFAQSYYEDKPWLFCVNASNLVLLMTSWELWKTKHLWDVLHFSLEKVELVCHGSCVMFPAMCYWLLLLLFIYLLIRHPWTHRCVISC